jgi:uncharacterized protein (TIGR03437 family)
MFRTSALLMLAAACTAFAQPIPYDIRGLYVSTYGLPDNKSQTAAVTSALSTAGIDGLLVVIGWDVLESTMGQYDFSQLDQWMSLAYSQGKHVELSIPAMYRTPSWLFDPAPAGGGAKPLFFSFTRRPTDTTCLTETIAAPWDSAFQTQWAAMLAAVSEHLKSTGTYDSLVLLRLTGINKDSDELHLPSKENTNATCVSDILGTWQLAGYRPSLLLQGWDGITSSFKKSFPEKTFNVAIIASANPFPPIGEDGSLITGPIPDLTLPLVTLAAQKLPGQFVIQNNSLYPNQPAQSETVQDAQNLGTMIAFQTNENVTAQGADCGAPGDSTVTPCTGPQFLNELESGIYPLGKSNSLRAQYIEVFALNVNDFPNETLQAHFELVPPVISLVANAEGESPTIAPNTWVEIKGSGLALTGESRSWKSADFINNLMPVTIDSISATVNGKPAFVYYASPKQINILTPPDAMSGPVKVVVSNNGTASTSFTTPAQPISPSFFVFVGGPYVAATHVSGRLLGPGLFAGSDTPAKPGEIAVLYANGFGPTSTPIVNGAITQSGALSPLPAVTIGGVNANVQFAGLISPGLFQFNVEVPSNTPDGDQPIFATYNGQKTQAGTLITVHH